MSHGEYCGAVIGRDLHVASHAFAARYALGVSSVSVVLAAYSVAVLSAHTPLGHRPGLAVAGEAMHGHAELRILWTPFVLGPPVAAVVVQGALAGEALEAFGERGHVCGRDNVVEVDVIDVSLIA